MSKRLVYICSPLRGDYVGNITAAARYCREAVKKSPDVIPIAPHIYFTQFLDDEIPSERSIGMAAGMALLDLCDEIWVYGIQNPSEGMQAEIDYALKNGIKIRDGFDHNNGAADPVEDLGDALLTLPVHAGSINGVAAIESTTVRIDGELIVDMAKALKRNRGHDITVEGSL